MTYLIIKYFIYLLPFVFILTKNKITIFFCFLLAFISFFKIYFILFEGFDLTEGIYLSILETNLDEVMNIKLIYFVIIAVSIISAILIITFTINLKNRIGVKKTHIIRLLSVLFIIALLLKPLIFSINRGNIFINFTESPSGFFLESVREPLGTFLFFTAYALEKNKYSNTEEDKALNKNITGFREPSSGLIVFIMGESSWKKRYSVYGYEKNTTKNISEIFLKNEKGCVLNAFSAATVTRDSIPLTFSFAKPDNYNPLTKENSVFELARKQGYSTYWIGTQPLFGLYDSKYGYLTKGMFNENIIKSSNDNDIPSHLDDVLKRNRDMKLITLHLKGSHIIYNNYDQIDKEQLKNTDEYDLTIHKTDRVINNIFNVLNKNNVPFVLIYTSDHGEVVNKGHGLINGRSQIEIPLLAYSNDKYNVCESYTKLENKNSEITAQSNKLILLDMIGVSLDSDFIKKESNDENMMLGNGDIINYKNFN